jgi:hypothetical protein
MPWLKITDTWDDHPSLLVSRSARLLHIEALTWAARQGTDGHLPRLALARVGDSDDPARDAAELVASGAWEATDVGWQVIALQDDQATAEEYKKRREAGALRTERWRRHTQGDHSLCDRCASVTRGVTRHEDVSDIPPSSPVQSRPVPARSAGDGDGRQAGASPFARATGDDLPEVEKHHHGRKCCALADFPNNYRFHWRPGECPGCDDPHHN